MVVAMFTMTMAFAENENNSAVKSVGYTRLEQRSDGSRAGHSQCILQ